MAIGLHRTECSIPDCESLSVAEHQLELVEHFLQSTLRYGTHDPAANTAVAVGDWIDSAIRLVMPGMRHHGVTLHREVDCNPLVVRGDLVLLQTCLTNLLTNALEAVTSQRRNAEETAKPLQIIVRCRQSNQRVVVEVIDNGPGPHPEIRDRLFDPLTTTKPEGSGLGLPVVKEIVQMHGGQVEWRRSDEGTCFQIDLPLAEKDPT
jgi:signal transduction histidine kinase